MILLDGKIIASQIEQEIIAKTSQIAEQPALAFILVGDNPASQSYVRGKQKAAARVGIKSIIRNLSATIAESDLIQEISKLNKDPSIHGILVQLPLPPHINAYHIACSIDPNKDVDAFHPINVGKLLLGASDGFLPCTPNGIKVLLERSQIPTDGKHVVIVGRSNIVGKPLAALLCQKKPHCNATVTLAHSHSHKLKELTRTADILVAAIGHPHFIKADMVKPNSVIIDVGINRTKSGALTGDVDFNAVAPLVSHITPVPGGVGPMTIAMLLQNTLQSFLQ